MPGWYTGSAMSPHLDGGLDYPILLAMMLVALLLRTALGGPSVEFRASCVPPGLWRARPGMVLGLVLGFGGLLLILSVLAQR